MTALASFPGSGNTWLRYLLQQVDDNNVYDDVQCNADNDDDDGDQYLLQQVDNNDYHDDDADDNCNGIILLVVVTNIRFTLQALNSDENALKTTSILCKRWNAGIFSPQRKGC